jgi:NCS1 family nucleobase:cation symporter-1
VWGPIAIFGSATSAAVATWCYIGGGFAAYYLPAASGIPALIASTVIGVFFVILAALPSSTRYGVEAVRSTRPTLGIHGSYITLIIVLATMIGWDSVLMVFLGDASTQILQVLGWIPSSTQTGVSVVASIVGLIIVIFLLRRGPDSVRDIGPVIAVGIIILSILIASVLLANVGLNNLLAAPALSAYGDQQLNFATVIEIGIAGGLSWWPYVGTITRYARSTKTAITPSILGIGWMMGLVLSVGMMAALAVPKSGGDPTLYLIGVGGPALGIIGLLFVIFANIGTTVIGIYVSALALKQSPTVDRKIGWITATILVAIPVAIVVVAFSGVFLEYYTNFLAIIGILVGPICGVQIADYYIIRRQSLNVRALYASSGEHGYWYTAGFNICGIVSLIIGGAVYFWFLNPLSYAPGPAFKFVTASVPTIIISGLLYLVLMSVTYRRRLGQSVLRSSV